MNAAITTMSLLPQGRTAQAKSTAVSAVSVSDAAICRLVKAMARGDEAAFRELYDAYYPRLFRLSLVLGQGDESLAQETVQAVFVTMAGKLREVESGDHLWNWLARVARQCIAKNWRRQQRNPVRSVEQLPEYAVDGTSDDHLESCLDAALLELNPEDRQLIEIFYFDRLCHREIAARFELTPKAVSSRLERVREKLRLLVAKKLSCET
jgi:RNA polymerase sigma factor (sigma-70 family)